MATMTTATADALRAEMKAYIGRYTDKVFDWSAFPASQGFPELARSQMRYIGAGGSPKSDDPGTLKPEHFTLSLVHQPVGKYGAAHAHEVEEAFLCLEGVLTVGWESHGEVVEARLGPKDMILHPPGRPHGFRNEGVEPVLVSIMVGTAHPRPPAYTYHPRSDDPALAAAFGAKPGQTQPFSPDGESTLQREMARYLVRHSRQRPEWHPAGFARIVYIGEGGAPAGHYRKDLVHLPRGKGVRGYARSVEEAYLVLRGCLTVGWEDNGESVEDRLGPKDLVFNPAGRVRYFRNDGIEDAQFMMVVGTPHPEDVRFQPA